MKKLLLLIPLLFLTGCLPNPPFGAGEKDEVSAVALAEKYNLATEIKAKYQLEGTVLKQTKIINPELDKYKNEPKDEIKIEIGDKPTGLLGAGETDFEPSITLTRWNEVNFKIKPKDLDKVASKDKNLKFEGDKIKFDTPKISFEMYEYAEGEGGYKFIWFLNEKPATNKVEFQIETSGLDFFYQPALNVENTDPNLTCTETQCKDKDGNVVVERPENVVGSYAVYHSTKGGMNDTNGKEYKVGKAFHIYRPHIIDAEGKETWGNLHIENGIYSVEIPQDFLDKAVYPIKSNDDFGYKTAGTTKVILIENKEAGSLFTGAVGSGISITASLSNDALETHYGKFGIYTHSDLALVTNGTTSEAGFTYTKGWRTINFSSAPTFSAVDYVIVVWGKPPTTGDPRLWGDAGDANQGHYQANTYSGEVWTNPLVPTHDNNKYSIYATYTPTGGPSNFPSDFIEFQ